MPTIDAANISFNLLKVAAGSGLTLGPMLLGVAKPVHVLTPSATVRRIVNMTALDGRGRERRPPARTDLDMVSASPADVAEPRTRRA